MMEHHIQMDRQGKKVNHLIQYIFNLYFIENEKLIIGNSFIVQSHFFYMFILFLFLKSVILDLFNLDKK
jgi:hypothetical protein